MEDWCTDEMTAEDRQRLLGWLTDKVRQETARGELVFPEWLVPSSGVVARTLKGDRLLAVLPVYFQRDCPFAQLGWCVANPSNVYGESHRAIRMLLAAAVPYASRYGAKAILSHFGNRRVNSLAEWAGYELSEIGETRFRMTH